MTEAIQDLECTLMFLFTLWACAGGHWIIAAISFVFLVLRAVYDS